MTRAFDTVIVGGLGHVGLPLGLAFARRDLNVGLLDIDQRKAAVVEAGRMPFTEHGAQSILEAVINKTLHVRLDVEVLREARTVIIATGTPVDEYLNPKVDALLKLFSGLKSHLDPEQTIIIRSTVYPRTCTQVRNLLEADGCTWHVARSGGVGVRWPEEYVAWAKTEGLLDRVAPSPAAARSARPGAIAPKIIPVSVEEAELAKLFSNAWRYIQFALANQFYMISQDFGVDFNRVRAAMTDGYGRAASVPTAGFAAGPCLLKDTMQLAAFNNNGFTLGHAAMMINEGLPNFLVESLRRRRDLTKTRVGILGMAFKGDIDDTRDSLSYKLGKILRFHGAHVLYSDEYAEDPTFVTKERLVAESDVVIIGAAHSSYRDLAMPDGVEVIDPWGLVRS